MSIHYIIAFLIFLKLIVSYLKSNTTTQVIKEEQEENKILDHKKVIRESIDSSRTVNYLSIIE